MCSRKRFAIGGICGVFGLLTLLGCGCQSPKYIGDSNGIAETTPTPPGFAITPAKAKEIVNWYHGPKKTVDDFYYDEENYYVVDGFGGSKRSTAKSRGIVINGKSGEIEDRRFGQPGKRVIPVSESSSAKLDASRCRVLYYAEARRQYEITTDNAKKEVRMQRSPLSPPAFEIAKGVVTSMSEPTGLKSPSINRDRKATIKLDAPVVVKPLSGTTQIQLVYYEEALELRDLKVGDRVTIEFTADGKLLDAGTER